MFSQDAELFREIARGRYDRAAAIVERCCAQIGPNNDPAALEEVKRALDQALCLARSARAADAVKLAALRSVSPYSPRAVNRGLFSTFG
jgi:hypothetical protein